MANWQELLDRKAIDRTDGPPVTDKEAQESDFAPPPDPKEYQPWILQRGGRPAMFLDLRRFEPKTGVLIGCQMSYPHLIAIDYIGDRMVSLDFGARQFVVEGSGLAELAGLLQQGLVLAIQEYSTHLWPGVQRGPLIRRIVQIRIGENQST